MHADACVVFWVCRYVWQHDTAWGTAQLLVIVSTHGSFGLQQGAGIVGAQPCHYRQSVPESAIGDATVHRLPAAIAADAVCGRRGRRVWAPRS